MGWNSIDATGHVYGRLTALHRAEKSKWLFRCECGVEKELVLAYVRDGRAKSCGCLRRDTTSKNYLKEITGLRSGKLVALSRLDERSKHKFVMWECLCDCGKKTVCSTSQITRQTKKSCGCMRNDSSTWKSVKQKKEFRVMDCPVYRSAKRKERNKDPIYAMRGRVSRMISHALASVNAVKSGSVFVTLGYTPFELKRHIERQFLDGMTWDNRSAWQVDHIIPISTASTEADVYALNQLSNLRPMWSAENSRKRNKVLTLL